MSRADNTGALCLLGGHWENLFSPDHIIPHHRCRHYIVSQIIVSLSGGIDAEKNVCTI